MQRLILFQLELLMMTNCLMGYKIYKKVNLSYFAEYLNFDSNNLSMYFGFGFLKLSYSPFQTNHIKLLNIQLTHNLSSHKMSSSSSYLAIHKAFPLRIHLHIRSLHFLLIKVYRLR